MNPRNVVRLLLALALVAALLGPPLIHQATAAPSEPALQRVTLVDLPVTSGANVLTSSLTLVASHPATALRFTCLVKSGATDAKLQPVVITAGGVSAAGALNSDSALSAGSWYTFTLGTAKASSNGSQELSYNVRFSASTTIAYLDVQEVRVP